MTESHTASVNTDPSTATGSWEEIQTQLAGVPGEEGVCLRREHYKRFFLQMADSVRIEAECYFVHPERIALDDDVRINRGAMIFGSGGIYLGRHVRVGPRCFIHSANHNIDTDDPRAFFEREHNPSTVTLGDNSLISADVHLLPGCRVGVGTFVAAGATVTSGKYPDGSYLAGCPARPMRTKSQLANTDRPVPPSAQVVVVTGQDPVRMGLWKHLLSSLGLPQVAVQFASEEVPNSARVVLLDGVSADNVAVSDNTVLWHVVQKGAEAASRAIKAAITASGRKIPLPSKKELKVRYHVSKESTAKEKAHFSALWLRDRLLKRAEPMSLSELADWLVTIRVLSITHGRKDRLLERLFQAIINRWPEEMTDIRPLSLPTTDSGLMTFIESTMDRVAFLTYGPDDQSFAAMRKRCLRLPALLIDRSLRDAASARELLSSCVPHCNNGHRLVALAVAARLAGLGGTISKDTEELLDQPVWQSDTATLPRADMSKTRPLISPLVIAWRLSRGADAGLPAPAPEDLFDEAVCALKLTWYAVGDPESDGSGRLACKETCHISASLLDGWRDFHEPELPERTQIYLRDEDYTPHIRDLEVAWLDAFWKILSSCGLPLVRLKPWPAPHKAAVSLRFDVDRPVKAADVWELVRMQSRYLGAPCGSWYIFRDDARRQWLTDLLALGLQETGLHLRNSSSAEQGFGATMHSSPNAEYWCGKATLSSLAKSKVSYSEFLAADFDVPRAALGSHLQGGFMLTPLHFPLEGGTRDFSLEYFDRLGHAFRSRIEHGGHAIVASHPDIAAPLLEKLLSREAMGDVWATTIENAVFRCHRIMHYGSVRAECSSIGLTLWSAASIADLGIEVSMPDKSVFLISTQLQAETVRLVKWQPLSTEHTRNLLGAESTHLQDTHLLPAMTTTDSFGVEIRSIFGPRHIRILDAGCGPRRALNVTKYLVTLTSKPIVFLERNAPRRNLAVTALGTALRPVDEDISRFASRDRFDVIYCDVMPKDLLNFFSATIHVAAFLLSQDGFLILNLPTGASIESAQSCFAPPQQELEALATFAGTLGQRDCSEISTSALCTKLNVPASRVLGSINKPVEACSWKTLIISRKAIGPQLRTQFPAQAAGAFSLEDYLALLETLGTAVDIVPLYEYIKLKLIAQATQSTRLKHSIKHDIHHDLVSALRMAQGEQSLGLSTAYFVMHDHALTARYFATKEFIDVLIEIQSYGHEIGLHVDAVDLIRKGSNTNAALREFLQRLREAGIAVRMGNTHGNTDVRHAWYNPRMVYSEMAPPGKSEDLEPELKPLFATESLASISQTLGLEAWVDATIYYEGKQLPTELFQVSDNYKCVAAYEINSDARSYKTLLKGEQWQLGQQFRSQLVETIKAGECLHLFHPQFFK